MFSHNDSNIMKMLVCSLEISAEYDPCEISPANQPQLPLYQTVPASHMTALGYLLTLPLVCRLFSRLYIIAEQWRE